MKETDNFVGLHSHTVFSNGRMLDSINRPEDIVNTIVGLNQKAVGVTDHGTCSGLMDVYTEIKKYNKKHGANLKMIFGIELYYTSNVFIKQDDLSHILFLAKDNIGLENLYKMTTVAHGNKGLNPENFYKYPRVDLDIVRQYHEGLICGTACMGGIIKRQDRIDVLTELKGIFNDDLYIELHTVQEPEQYEFNNVAIECGNKLGIDFFAANDAHYPTPNEHITHKQFREAKNEKGDEYYKTNDYYFHSGEETKKKLSYLPTDIVERAIANTVNIADKCNVVIDYSTKHYPQYPCSDPLQEVKNQCNAGYKEKKISQYPDRHQYIDRVKMELDVLDKQDYCSYFLITSDLYRFGRENRYPMGDGRGSVVASAVAWLMGITQLDPIKYNLVFERFAHMSRIAPPDKEVCRAS